MSSLSECPVSGDYTVHSSEVNFRIEQNSLVTVWHPKRLFVSTNSEIPIRWIVWYKSKRIDYLDQTVAVLTWYSHHWSDKLYSAKNIIRILSVCSSDHILTSGLLMDHKVTFERVSTIERAILQGSLSSCVCVCVCARMEMFRLIFARAAWLSHSCSASRMLICLLMGVLGSTLEMILTNKGTLYLWQIIIPTVWSNPPS